MANNSDDEKRTTSAFSRWKQWATGCNDIPVLPVEPMHVVLYLSYLLQTSKIPAPLEETVNALSWVHRMATVEDITAHLLVQQVLARAKRLLAHKTSRKELITVEHLESLVERFDSKDASLTDIIVLTFCLLGFAGFLRFDELSHIRIHDISFHQEYMELFVES